MDKYISCMLLHALGDTIGFKNGEWEFGDGGYERTLKKVYEFIYLGGITGIDLEGWLVSDDTIMHMLTAKALLDYDMNDSMDTLGKLFTKYFLVALKQFEVESNKRAPGNATIKSLIKLRHGSVWNENRYDIFAGGSGASMRSLCIGMAFWNNKDLHKLIQISIESGRITNNSAVGYLGGMTSALFAALAVQGVNINEWPFVLLELFNDKTIHKYIKLSGRDYEEFIRDSPVFIEKWSRYVDDKFDENRNVVKNKIFENLIYRCKYYNDTFGFRKDGAIGLNKKASHNEKMKTKDDDKINDKIKTRMTGGKEAAMTGGKGVVRAFGTKDFDENNNIKPGFIGSGGDDSVIIAYDALIDCGGIWEKLIYYSALHMGDTDTTGSIAGGLYGLVYGMGTVGEHLLKHLEYKDELEEIGKTLYKKYKKMANP